MAVILAAGLLGCVELPGICYEVLVDDRPSERDCLTLTDVLTAKLGLELQPSLYPCAVTLDNGGSDPARKVAIRAYFRQRRIVVEIDEVRVGGVTTPSASTREFAQQVMRIVHEQFPTAEVVHFTSKRSLFAG